MDSFAVSIWALIIGIALMLGFLVVMDKTVWTPQRDAIRAECTSKGGVMLPTREYSSKGGPTYGDYKCFRNIEEVK